MIYIVCEVMKYPYSIVNVTAVLYHFCYDINFSAAAVEQLLLQFHHKMEYFINLQHIEIVNYID